MKYGFYSKHDPSKEIITQAAYTSAMQAWRDFAYKKNMDVDTFLRLYEVVQIK